MILNRVYFIPLFFAVVICCSQQERAKTDCSEYNNAALISLQDYFNKPDSLQLLETLDLYEKAIQCDTTNLNTHQGKFTTLYLLGRYHESLRMLDKIYQLGNRKDVKVLASKGLVYERMNLADSAQVVYKMALSECDRQLEEHPVDRIRIVCDKLYILAIHEGKEYSLRQLDQYLSERPNDTVLLDFRIYLRDFDKSRILFR